jgi:hypothetical protein
MLRELDAMREIEQLLVDEIRYYVEKHNVIFVDNMFCMDLALWLTKAIEFYLVNEYKKAVESGEVEEMNNFCLINYERSKTGH